MCQHQHRQLVRKAKDHRYSAFFLNIGDGTMKFLNTLIIISSLLLSGLVSAQTVEVDDDSFKCLTEMTPVRGFFVDNILGDLEATVKAAESEKDIVYPVGSVVQLVPSEVMIKREAGFNAVTKDWEFFELQVTEAGSKIHVRGAFEVVNKFGGNCFACHIKAKPEFDLICEQSHGCDPILLPNGTELSQAMIKGIQKTDPRCASTAALMSKEGQELAAK